MELSIIDLFAKEYGWSRHQIENDIFLDEYFTQKEIIEKRQKQEYIMQAHLSILPNLDSKDIQKFFEELSQEEQPTLIGKEVKTDFKALADAKKMFGN